MTHWLRDFLLPGAAEKDERFRAEILKLSVRGLYVIGLIEIGGPLFTLFGRWLLRVSLHAGVPIQRWSHMQMAAGISLGVLTLLAARTRFGKSWPRLVGCLSGWLTAALMITLWLVMAQTYPESVHHLPSSVTIVLLVGVASFPLRPLQTLALGLAIEGYAIVAWQAALRWQVVQVTEWDALTHLFNFLVVLICTGMSALMYAERRSEYGARLRAVAAAEALCTAQARVMVAESTASLGRLAAGLLHELNSPLGALSSGANTLLAISAKLSAASAQERARLLALQQELGHSLLDSVQRLQQIVNRVWNLTSLEEAEMLPTDLNEMLAGASSAYQEQARQRGITVELDLQPMPAVSVRRAQLKAAFTVLLINALDAVAEQGRISVSTRRRDHEVEVKLTDNGKGIPADQLESIFSPGFSARGGRMAARNWGLFSARQIVLSHGGEILITSEPGRGTEVTVTLPV